MLLFVLSACGGPGELPKPHDPPAWPLENMHVKRRPHHAPHHATPEGAGHQAEPAPTEPAPEPAPAPEPSPVPEEATP
ncbi:MAG: hypothetical protein KC656_01275 [Myxococcales bacterium]|nr:hypothetical protein [Myxococcales bacterium]MCB9670670.1 hypothetical protein [Alphaproteobacteria bacterium]MCB9693768.1 hypothetical protein [Alphaproteobacteria bacterium]